MKYLLVILLSLSLYGPDITRLVAYADYIVEVISSEKVSLCDCGDILKQAASPADHRDHSNIVSTVWVYILPETFVLPSTEVAFSEEITSRIKEPLPGISYSIFQPPRI